MQNNINILFIGDIVGKSGREAVKEILPKLKKDYKINFVIANGENAAGGLGITPKVLEEILFCGIDVVTTGNHVWNKKEIYEVLNNEKRILRPLNYPEDAPGKGSGIFSLSNKIKIAVINLSGRTFMEPIEHPFICAEKEVKKLNKKTKIIIVDFHAEATSEKKALVFFLDGKISALIGTHTHVQTADEQILLGGTAYISDVGMTGAYNSVIGMEKEIILKRFLTQIPIHFKVAEGGEKFLCGVIIQIDKENGKTVSIKRIQEKIEVNL